MFSGRMLFGFGERDSPVESVQFLQIPKQRNPPRDTAPRVNGSGVTALNPTTDRQSHVGAATDTEHAARMASTQKRWLAAAVVVIVGAGLSASVLVNPVVAGAALVTGILNTAGGGGAVVTFLALTATGVPALTAHATSQLVTPASFLSGLRPARTHRPDRRWVAAGGMGVVCGVAILAITPLGVFQSAAPWCLLAATALVATQSQVQRFVRSCGWFIGPTATLLGVFLCGVYAGLIGIGTGTLAVAVLGLVPAFIHARLADLLRIRNILLTAMAVVVAVAVAVTGLADWRLVALLVVPAAVGGWLGTKIIGRVPGWLLRATIVVTALAAIVWMMTLP